MIVTILYPHHPGARLDTAYYRESHARSVSAVWQPTGVTMIEGVPAADGSPAPFALIAHFAFASAEAMTAALADPRSAALTADVANFTNIQPQLMIGRPL